jgi:acetyl-CoA carboxylase carboxyl transferase subunit alpha
MQNYLDFEKPLAEIEGKAEELRALGRRNKEMDVEAEAVALDRKATAMLAELYRSLDPWRKCQVARHPDRPHCRDYIDALFGEWTPLAGDRSFAEDQAILGGLARFRDRPVVVIGTEKGNDTRSRIERNFGMARPEGYRKAIRLMDLADRFDLPVVTLVDTPGAYPGKGAEERGQAEAIARATERCLDARRADRLGDHRRGRVGRRRRARHRGPGGDAGALDLLGDLARGLRLDPVEGRREDARGGQALRLTAQDLLALGVIDRIIPEPVGGAQRHRATVIAAVGEAIGGC